MTKTTFNIKITINTFTYYNYVHGEPLPHYNIQLHFTSSRPSTLGGDKHYHYWSTLGGDKLRCYKSTLGGDKLWRTSLLWVGICFYETTTLHTCSAFIYTQKIKLFLFAYSLWHLWGRYQLLYKDGGGLHNPSIWIFSLLVGFGRACAPVRCAHPSFWAH
jgi:hypothetical protein